MRLSRVEILPKVKENHHLLGMGMMESDEPKIKIRGDVFMTVRDAKTNEILDYREKRNLVVYDASILIARLLKDNKEPSFGIYALAVGTGGTGWDLQNPPAPTKTQRSLYNEVARKTFTETRFIDENGLPVSYPTNVIDFTTTFSESEAVGPLVEMGLIGGNISTNMSIRNPVLPPNGTRDTTVDLSSYETLVNYFTMKVINKPPTSTFTITWRLTL